MRFPLPQLNVTALAILVSISPAYAQDRSSPNAPVSPSRVTVSQPIGQAIPFTGNAMLTRTGSPSEADRGTAFPSVYSRSISTAQPDWDDARFHGIAPSGYVGYYDRLYLVGNTYRENPTARPVWDNNRYHGVAPSGYLWYSANQDNNPDSLNRSSSNWRRWDTANNHAVDPNAYP